MTQTTLTDATILEMIADGRTDEVAAILQQQYLDNCQHTLRHEYKGKVTCNHCSKVLSARQ